MNRKNNLRLLCLIYITFIVVFCRCKKEQGPFGDLPSIFTTAVTNISTTGAASGGVITSDGKLPIIEKGLCWNTTSSPTTLDNKIISSVEGKTFTDNLKNLNSSSTYFIRAFATNALGTAYGEVFEFTTNVLDVDGNIYETIKIGNQIWLKKNLKTTHYANGDPIPRVITNYEWENTTIGAYCNYSNNEKIGNSNYGKLYNYNAIADKRGVCPVGWHIPNDDEWRELLFFLGGVNEAGGKLKESGTEHWLSPNTGATNISGFTALPTGYRAYGGFYNIGNTTFNWSSASSKFMHILSFDGSAVAGTGAGPSVFGLPIRCIKD